MSLSIVQKYNFPGPRYTSYPTVHYWEEQNFNLEDWKRTLLQSFKESNATEGISLYIHLPFCESLCTFCGCHKYITTNHQVESRYIDAVLKEWEHVASQLSPETRIAEIHLGGGTPTFFAPGELKRLILGLKQLFPISEDLEFGFEAHPNSTTEEHLQLLYQLGFRRISFGIQDYDPKVQKAIHRVQSFEQVKKVHDLSRKIGYESISHDLIFGLPFQTEESIRNTIKNTIALKPDRIAYYSYAHVPWTSRGQRLFDEADLPDAVPFIDEILLGLGTLLLANWKNRKAPAGMGTDTSQR